MRLGHSNRRSSLESPPPQTRERISPGFRKQCCSWVPSTSPRPPSRIPSRNSRPFRMRTNMEDFLAQFLVGREGGDIYIGYAYRELEKSLRQPGSASRRLSVGAPAFMRGKERFSAPEKPRFLIVRFSAGLHGLYRRSRSFCSFSRFLRSSSSWRSKSIISSSLIW